MNKHVIASWIFLIVALILLIKGRPEMAIASIIFSELQQIQSELHDIKEKNKNDI